MGANTCLSCERHCRKTLRQALTYFSRSHVTALAAVIPVLSGYIAFLCLLLLLLLLSLPLPPLPPPLLLYCFYFYFCFCCLFFSFFLSQNPVYCKLLAKSQDIAIPGPGESLANLRPSALGAQKVFLGLYLTPRKTARSLNCLTPSLFAGFGLAFWQRTRPAMSKIEW